MALTSSGVQQAREIFNNISNEMVKLGEVREVINFMNSNDDFSKFVSGTTFGQENYEKWQKLLKLLSSDLNQALTNLNKATENFLQRQDYYNKLQAIQTLGSASSSTDAFLGSNVEYMQGSYQNGQLIEPRSDGGAINLTKFIDAKFNTQNQAYTQQQPIKTAYKFSALGNNARNGQY